MHPARPCTQGITANKNHLNKTSIGSRSDAPARRDRGITAPKRWQEGHRTSWHSQTFCSSLHLVCVVIQASLTIRNDGVTGYAQPARDLYGEKTRADTGKCRPRATPAGGRRDGATPDVR